jgi:prolyl oligopeptidase
MKLRAILSFAALLWACTSPAKVQTLPQRAIGKTSSALPDSLARMNADLRRQGAHDSVGTLQVDDPFRALEQDNAQTQAWIQAQTERTERALEPLRDAKAEARLSQLLAIGTIGEVALGGSRVFFTLREAPRERPALYVIDSAQTARESVLAKPALIDPQTYGERAALDYIFPARDGHLVAFGISENGDERSTLRVYDVDRQQLLPDTIEHAKWSSVDWLNDGSGFYYRRYPKPGEANWNEREPDSYYSYLFMHRLGQPTDNDPLVFAGERPIDFPSAAIDETDRYVVITNQRSWTASDVWLWDRGKTPATRAAAPAAGQLSAVVRDEDKSSSGSVQQGQLYLVTNLGAPKKQVIRVAVEHAADRTRWQTVVPESAATIEDAVITRNFIVVHTIEDVRSKLKLFTLAGEARGEIDLPGLGSLAELESATEHDRIAFVWSSFLHAPTLFSCDVASRKLEQLYQVQHDFSASRYELRQEAVKSADGTLVNVFYVQRRDTARDAQNPVLISGYGGFDLSLLPSFSRSALYFLEQGGIYAQANLRGGGEYGETWHRAGMLKNKQHVFEDFEAVVRWFSSSGLSNPSRIAITGGSNGGLLMGALITRAPASFAAAAAYVGLYDMLRYPRFPPAALWTSEYGDPSDAEMARYLLAYSPYHNVRDRTAYPAALIETADHDTRVFWGHSAKFAARLQEASSSDKPVYFYMERAVGHGRGTGIADLVRRYARQYAFLRGALGMQSAPSMN